MPTPYVPRAAVEKAPEAGSVNETASKTFGYEEGGKAAPSGGGSAGSAAVASLMTPASATTSGSPAAALGAGVVSGGPSGGGATGGGGDFWKTVGGEVDSENQQIAASEAKLSLKNLRGALAQGGKKGDSMPGKDLSDQAFWKKVGKEPAKCRVATELSKIQKQKCLRTARKEIERKWRQSQRAKAEVDDSVQTLPAKTVVKAGP